MRDKRKPHSCTHNAVCGGDRKAEHCRCHEQAQDPEKHKRIVNIVERSNRGRAGGREGQREGGAEGWRQGGRDVARGRGRDRGREAPEGGGEGQRDRAGRYIRRDGGREVGRYVGRDGGM